MVGMDIQTFLTNIGAFLNDVILPFIFAIAGLMFMVNAVRYFIIGGSNPEDQEKAKTLAIWGILAFVITISLWGIVNILVDGLGLTEEAPTPDYLEG
jgi:succinate dehydrogenase/fumarate reductase cytochrome b subunit